MPQKGYRQTAAHRAKKAKAVMGKKNGRWKGGVHYTTYRKLAGAKRGEVTHHRDGNRRNNTKSNLQVLRDGKKIPGRRTTAKHELLTKRARK